MDSVLFLVQLNQTIHVVLRDDLIRLFVGVPLLSGVSVDLSRIGCVKPAVVCVHFAFWFFSTD